MLKLFGNPLVRMLAVIVVIAAGIRLIFELLAPVMPYLAALAVVFAVFRVVSWRRNRW